MKTKKVIAAAVAASLLGAAVAPTSAFATYVQVVRAPVYGQGPTWVPFTIMGCAGGIILAALAANARDHRELTAQEAWTCGIMFWFSQPGRRSVQAPVRAKG
jgi:hypothetical protein